MIRLITFSKNTATATIVLVAAVVLSGCGLSETRLSDDTTPVASTSPSEAATPSSEAATPAPRTTNSPSSPAETDNTPTPSVTKTPKPAATSPAPVRSARASKPAKSVIPCGMMDIKTKEMGKCPPPVVPAKIILGESYPWFPVAPGKLAEPWGFTGELLFANDYITVLQITPNEIVVARDLFDLRGVSKIIGVNSIKVVEESEYRTFIQFLCNGVIMTGRSVKHYRHSNVLAASLWVLYIEEIGEFEQNC